MLFRTTRARPSRLFGTVMAAPLDPLAEAFRWAHVAVAVLEATLGQVALQASRDHPPALERFSFYSAWLELAAT